MVLCTTRNLSLIRIGGREEGKNTFEEDPSKTSCGESSSCYADSPGADFLLLCMGLLTRGRLQGECFHLSSVIGKDRCEVVCDEIGDPHAFQPGAMWLPLLRCEVFSRCLAMDHWVRWSLSGGSCYPLHSACACTYFVPDLWGGLRCWFLRFFLSAAWCQRLNPPPLIDEDCRARGSSCSSTGWRHGPSC